MFEIAIFIVAFFLGFLVSRISFYLYESNPDKLESITTHKGYHVHHSVYGVTSFFAVPFMLGNHHFITTIILIGLGLGIIIDHTIEEGFMFITKDED